MDLIFSLTKLCNRIKEIAERDFSTLNEVLLNKKIYTDTWSISECLNHNILILENYFPKVEKAVLVKDLKMLKKNRTVFKSGYLGGYFVNAVRLKEDNTITKRKRSVNFLNPQQVEGFGNQVLSRFLYLTDKLINLMAYLKDIDLSAISIPMKGLPFIRLSLGDMLCYIIYHVERHFVQAQRIFIETSFQNKKEIELMNQ
jgi:hypothetical protein